MTWCESILVVVSIVAVAVVFIVAAARLAPGVVQNFIMPVVLLELDLIHDERLFHPAQRRFVARGLLCRRNRCFRDDISGNALLQFNEISGFSNRGLYLPIAHAPFGLVGLLTVFGFLLDLGKCACTGQFL